MEIERNVKIEPGRNPVEERKAGFSSGPHTTNALPDYTREEMQQVLGGLSEQIQTLISELISDQLAAGSAAPQSKPESPAPAQSKSEPEPGSTQPDPTPEAEPPDP